MSRALQGSERELFEELARRLRVAGCFGRCDRHYRNRLALIVPLFAATYGALLVAPGGLVRSMLAIAVAFVSVQLGIVSHDAGHRMVDRRRFWNDVWGHFGMTFACGLSFTHWRIVHNAHHRHPQDEHRDPDMQYAAVFSVYVRAAEEKRGLARVVRPFQHLYFWPLGALYSWSLRWDSIMRAIHDRARTRVDRWVLTAHYMLWLVVPVALVGPRIAFTNYALTSAAIGLYLVTIFAPSHMGMPSLGDGEACGYLSQQLSTARDLNGGRVLALVFGGLEHQIEHHLFPSVGQPQLRIARQIVTEFCAEHALPHYKTSFLVAHREVLAHLARMARVRVGGGEHEAAPG